LFTIANSFFITIFPLLYLHHVHESLNDEERSASPISLGSLSIFIPLYMGVVFAALYPFFKDLGIPRKVGTVYVRFGLSGALAAFSLSLILDYGFGLYTNLFHFQSPSLVHGAVAVFYFFVFNIVGVWCYKKLENYFEDDSAGSSPAVSRSPSIAGSISSAVSSDSSASAASSTSSKSESVYDALSKHATKK
jgi:hypothetical protein